MCPTEAKLVITGNDKAVKPYVARAAKKLEDVFTNPSSNSSLILTFSSSEIFTEREAEELRIVNNKTVVFTENFCARLQDRYSVLKALNQLLNLDPNLANYQRIIRGIFIELFQKKRVRVYCDCHTYNLDEEELEQLLDVQKWILILEPEPTFPPEKEPFIPGGFKKTVSKRASEIIIGLIILVIMGIAIILFVFSCKLGIYCAIQEPPTNSTTLSFEVTTLNPPTSSPSIPFFTETVAPTKKQHSKDFASANKNVEIPLTPEIDNITAAKTVVSIQEKVKEKAVAPVIYADNPANLNEEKEIKAICNPNVYTPVTLHIEYHFDWYGVRIDCATRIFSLKIESYASIRNVHEILNQTSNIRNLTLECDKIGLRHNALVETLPRIALQKLKYLEIYSTNVNSDCSLIFLYLAQNVIFLKLQHLKISGLSITDQNKPEIQRLFSKMSASTPSKIILNDVVMREYLDIRIRRMAFSEFQFKVNNISSPTGSTDFALLTFINFISYANYATEISTNIPIPDQTMSTLFEHLVRLGSQKLSIKVKVRSDRKEFKFDFTRKLKSLKSLDFGLLDWDNKHHTNPHLFLINFNKLPATLKEFRLTTNFNARDRGAYDVHCRNFNKTGNSQGGINIMLDLCPECNAKGYCLSTRR